MRLCSRLRLLWLRRKPCSPAFSRQPLPSQVKRTNVAAMMAQQGFVEDVFAATQKYLKERRRK